MHHGWSHSDNRPKISLRTEFINTPENATTRDPKSANERLRGAEATRRGGSTGGVVAGEAGFKSRPRNPLNLEFAWAAA